MLRTATRHSAIGTDRAKIDECAEIARRWSEARRTYAREYSGIEHLSTVLGSARIASNKRARAGWCDIALNYHYHKTAFESAMAILNGGWETTFARVRTLIGRNKRFSDGERHELFYLMKAPTLLAEVLAGGVPTKLTEKPEFAKNDHPMLCAYLRRMVRRRLPATPRLARTDGFELDNTLYALFAAPKPGKRRSKTATARRFAGPWIAVSRPDGGERIRVPLAGTDLSFLDSKTRRNLRAKVQSDGRIEFQIPYDLPDPEAQTSNAAERPEIIVGIDKGYRVLLASSADGDPANARFYSSGFGDLCDTIDVVQQRRAKNRDRLRSHQRALRKRGDPASRRKARNIGRHNLGSSKHGRRLDAEKATIKNAVGRGVNEFMIANPEMTILVEERLSGGGKSKGRTWNRRLSGWVRGALAESLNLKTSAHGVRRQEVNLWTPKARVKAILLARRQAVVRSATCGSNSPSSEAGRAVNTVDASAGLTHG
jgi:hypothetical protein